MMMLEAGEVLGGMGSISQQIGMSPLFLHRQYCCCCCQEQQMMNRSLGVAHDWYEYDDMLFYSSRSAVATAILFLDDEDRRREEGGRGHAWYEENPTAIMRDKRMRNEKMDGKEEEARGGRQMENNNIDV